MSDSAAPVPEPSAPTDDGRRWRAFWVCAVVAALTVLDITKVNVALPAIEQALSADSTALQLVVSGYILAFGLVLVPMGRLGDQSSRRLLLLIGLGLFGVASAGCALASDIGTLLVARLVQGIAAGVLMPQVLGTVQQLFTGAERGRAFGMFGALIGLATAFGPTVGGLFIAWGGESDGWRGIFWMNVPLFCVAALLVARLLPERRERVRRRPDLDPVGVLLFAGSIVALLVPFLFTTGTSDDHPMRWLSLVGFVALGAGFLLWERRYARRGRTPLVPLGLFRTRSFRFGTLVMAAYFSAMPTIFLLTTLYLQSGVGASALHAGMATIGFALTSAVASWYGGRLVARYGRTLVIVGLVWVMLGVLALAFGALMVGDAHAVWVTALILLVSGVGGGLVISPNQTLTLADVPRAEAGVAGSIGQLGQRVGTAIGTAVGLSLFYATIAQGDGRSGTGEVFHQAYAIGMASVCGFVALALVASLIDARRRAHADGAPVGDH